MENMDKGFTVPKWVVIVWPKTKCPRIYLPNLSAQAQKSWISMKKGFIGRPQSVFRTISDSSNVSSKCFKVVMTLFLRCCQQNTYRTYPGSPFWKVFVKQRTAIAATKATRKGHKRLSFPCSALTQPCEPHTPLRPGYMCPSQWPSLAQFQVLRALKKAVNKKTREFTLVQNYTLS